MITENVSTLKIHKLSQAQYDRELAVGNIDENALYLTPDTSPDWNVNDETAPDYIKNRPFYEKTIMGDTLTWDGNIDGLVAISHSYQSYFKVSDVVLSLEDVQKECYYITSQGYESNFELVDISISKPYFSANQVFVDGGNTITIVLDENNAEDWEKGIYFSVDTMSQAYVKSFTINGCNKFPTTELKTLDPKYLPEHLQFGESEQLTQFVPETTLSEYTEDNGIYYVEIEDSIKYIEIGKRYDITFDGVLYENLQCFSDYECAALGSPYDDLTHNSSCEYPFNLYYYKDDEWAGYSISVKDTEPHTIKVEGFANAIIKLNEEYLPQHKHSWNDLTDKPFGDIPFVYIDCNPEMVRDHSDKVWQSYYTENINGIIEAGKIYNVTIDGVIYENLTCIQPSSSDQYLGSSISDLENGVGEYSFSIYWNSYYKLYNGYFTDDKEHHIKVEESVPSVKQIEEKFIPDSIARTYHTHSWDDLEDKPFGDINNVLYSTDTTLCKLDGTSETSVILSDFDVSIFQFNKDYTIKVNDYTFVLEWQAMSGGAKAFQGHTENGDYFSLYNSGGATSEVRFKKIEWSYGAELTPKTYDVHIDISDGKYTKQIEEKYIPDTIARTEYVDANFALKSDLQNIDLSALETKEDAQLKYDTITAAKANWNQNDETAIDYIRNRPFYETEPIRTAILPETTIDVEQYGNSVIFTMPVEEGKTYTVTFDGVEYNCVARGYEGYYNYCIVLGNGTLGTDGNPGNNEPFSIDCPVRKDDATASEFWYDLYAEEGSHTVEVCTNVTTIVQLEKKYIAKHLEEIAGKKVEGKEFTIDGEQVIAAEGAEIFNNRKNIATGEYSHAEGIETIASGHESHAEGCYTLASGVYSHAEGYSTIASGSCAHAEGGRTTASGENAHAEGYETTATGEQAHAEGENTNAVGKDSHAEGHGNTASGHASHVEGWSTTASGSGAHAEGDNADAKGDSSHAEGSGTNAEGNYSHAEGHHSETFGIGSHAEGYYARAYGDYSHAEGYLTSAKGQNQHVQGKYNIVDNNNTYAHIVGNGTSGAELSNAHTLDWQGNAWYQGTVESTAIILKSPNGTRFKITVGDDGILTSTEIIE